MPLKRGKSKRVVSQNISELVKSFKKTRKIGNSKPKSKKAAIAQAVAISLKLSGRSKKKSSKSKKK